MTQVEQVAALLRAHYQGADVEALVADVVQKLTLASGLPQQQQQQSIATHGLPPLGTHVASRPSSESNKGSHARAQLHVKQFAPLRESPLDPSHPSLLWGIHNEGEMARWGSDEDIKELVARALNDVINATCLGGQLKCCKELHFDCQRADVWVVRERSGVPVGVVEVRRPGDTMMTSPLAHGQVYDHMKMLQSFHGLRRVFGIAATYDEWRVYWLDATDDLAHADALDSPPKDVGEDGDEDEDRRVLHASRVYKRDDPTLPSILASVIVKMHHSLSFGFLPKERRPRIHMNAKAWYWTGSCDVDDYDETEMPPRNARDFILLEDFGCGADGRAWKACTPQQGKVCVLKLAHARPLETSEHRKARLQEECDRWLVVWSMEARVIPLVGDWALLMPYVRPLLTRVLSRPVQAAVDAMATKGYCHEDLVWRHVGCIGEGKEQRVVFFDLGRVTKMEPKIAAERMLQQLREDLKHGLPHA